MRKVYSIEHAKALTCNSYSFWDETDNHLNGHGYSSTYFMSLEQVAKYFRLSRERIRQIEAKAIRKLQHPKRSSLLKPFITDDFNLDETLEKYYRRNDN